MSVIKIIIEKNSSEFANAALIATFNWNISSTEELASVSPFELMYGQLPRLPCSVSVLFADAEKFQEVNASNYENYADYLDSQLSRSQEAFLEARYNAGIARLHRGNFKFADVTKICHRLRTAAQWRSICEAIVSLQRTLSHCKADNGCIVTREFGWDSS